MKISLATKFNVKQIKKDYPFYGLVLLFALFLMPISFTVSGDRVSGNYSFIFFPVIALIFNKKIQIPSKNILAIIGIYIFIFVTCLIYQLEYQKFWDRRFISFILFLSMFTFFLILK